MPPARQRQRHVLLALACAPLLLACVEPKQAEPTKTPANVLIGRPCGNYRPVQAPVGGVHPKERPARGEDPRPFDEDPLCAPLGPRP